MFQLLLVILDLVHLLQKLPLHFVDLPKFSQASLKSFIIIA